VAATYQVGIVGSPAGFPEQLLAAEMKVARGTALRNFVDAVGQRQLLVTHHGTPSVAMITS